MQQNLTKGSSYLGEKTNFYHSAKLFELTLILKRKFRKY